MSVDDLWISQTAIVLRAHGKAVAVHSKKRGTVTSCYALIEKNVEQFPSGFESTVSERVTVASLGKSDVPRLTRGDLIVDGSTSYEVQDVDEDDDYLVRATVK